ncbi:MAG TPA: ribosome maturation factor RimM [Terriglobia bacterium]|jgi:16S rRNA processing protein RimM|nr:ribosome maturation factor RimM [Terriglobia bacterium]
MASQNQAQGGARLALAESELRGFVAIACIVRPQGRKGEVLAEILTDFPSRFTGLQHAFLNDPGNIPWEVKVERTWLHKGKVVLKFAGVDSIDGAEELRGRYVLVPEQEKVVLAAHQYYWFELKGCQVDILREGTRHRLGVVTDVEPTGGADLLHVFDGAEDILVPLAQDICKVIDTEARLIVIEPPEDLLDLNR